jgi:hypothetical protein
MKGWKTLIVSIVSMVGGVLTAMGYTIEPETLTAISDSITVIVGGLMVLYGAVMVVLRAVTSTPMFDGQSVWEVLKRLAGIAPLMLIVPLVLFGGCAGTPQMEKPDTVKKAIATAHYTIGGLNGGITDLRIARLIDARQFARFAEKIDEAEAFVVRAEALRSLGDIDGAQSRLDQAIKILDVIQPIIQEKLDELERARRDATAQRIPEGDARLPDPV